ASANTAVYTKLRLQILFISKTTKRECAISPVFLSSQDRRSPWRTPMHPGSPRLRCHRVEGPGQLMRAEGQIETTFQCWQDESPPMQQAARLRPPLISAADRQSAPCAQRKTRRPPACSQWSPQLLPVLSR